MSMNNTNPSTLFGGTWIQLKDRFLLGVGDTYKTANSTGGNSTVTLSTANLPAHTHSIGGHTHTYAKVNGTTGSHTLTIDEMPNHNHTVSNYSQYSWSSRPTGSKLSSTIDNADGASNKAATNYTGGGKGHTHTIATTSTNTGSSGSGNTHNHSFTGISQNTMPPYLVVYVWKRTA